VTTCTESEHLSGCLLCRPACLLKSDTMLAALVGFVWAAAITSATWHAIDPSPRPETDWLSSAGHGVFTHFLNGLQNDDGRNSQGMNTVRLPPCTHNTDSTRKLAPSDGRRVGQQNVLFSVGNVGFGLCTL